MLDLESRDGKESSPQLPHTQAYPTHTQATTHKHPRYAFYWCMLPPVRTHTTHTYLHWCFFLMNAQLHYYTMMIISKSFLIRTFLIPTRIHSNYPLFSFRTCIQSSVASTMHFLQALSLMLGRTSICCWLVTCPAPSDLTYPSIAITYRYVALKRYYGMTRDEGVVILIVGIDLIRSIPVGSA